MINKLKSLILHLSIDPELNKDSSIENFEMFVFNQLNYCVILSDYQLIF